MKAIKIYDLPERIEKSDSPMYDGNYIEELGEGIFLCPMKLDKAYLEFPNDWYLIENTPDGVIELEIPTSNMGWYWETKKKVGERPTDDTAKKLKTYLTKNGLLVVREDASFFTSNSGEFRRIATGDEVDYLINYPLTEVNLGEQVAYGVRARRRDGDVTLRDILANMEIPLWHYLWSISNDDYSNYKPGTCSNGGDYSYHEHIHFFARHINGEWEIRTLTTYSTSAEFSYDELSGSFQSNLDRVELIGIAGNGEEWWISATKNGGEDGEIVLDQLLDEGSWDVEAALTAVGHYIPERDSDEEECDQELTDSEIARRKEICNVLGLHEKSHRIVAGRNQRR